MDEEYIVKIISIEQLNYNVKRFTFEKPPGYKFVPGQAADVSINLPRWKLFKNPFSFTSLNEWPHLEFTIKIYKERNGVTAQMDTLKAGDEFIVREPWGAIQYKGEGTFIAAGAGVTPFIAIFRQLDSENKIGSNKLICSNKKTKDIILKDEFSKMLGDNFINILTQEKNTSFRQGRIDEEKIKELVRDFKKQFYVCGPTAFVQAMKKILLQFGASAEEVVLEK